jgi:hypothetical protein
MKRTEIKHALAVALTPGIIFVWMIGWVFYCAGDRPPGRLERWLEKVAHARW